MVGFFLCGERISHVSPLVLLWFFLPSIFSMREWIDFRIGKNLRIILGMRIGVCFKKGFPVVFDESVEGGFVVLIDGADGRHQAGVQKRFHPFAELIRRSLSPASYFAFHCQAACISGTAALL